jgi:hypothetical protein
MTRGKFLTLAGSAAVLLAAGIWLSAHRANVQADLGGGMVFADLKPALGDIEQIRLSKGDGSRTTLRKAGTGWTVVEREYPADANRVRELALALAGMKVVERKTSDPANYAKLGVEATDSPTAASTLVEVVAGKQSWALIVGKGAEGRAVYVRKPKEVMSALVEPFVSADPDQKRWLDRLITDLPGADVHEIAVTPASGASYLLRRAQRGAADLVLTPIPKGRTAVSAMSIDGQAEVLAAFNFDEVHTPAAAAPTDHAVYRTFDGQVIELAGRRDGEKAFVRVTARRDPALAAQFPAPAAPAPAAPVPAAPDKAATDKSPTPAPAPAVKPAAHTVERLAARSAGVEYEIPIYKYEALFKPLEELLEKPPTPAKKK